MFESPRGRENHAEVRPQEASCGGFRISYPADIRPLKPGKEVFNGDIGTITDVNLEDRELQVRFDDREITTMSANSTN